jgi:hypothetical protein
MDDMRDLDTLIKREDEDVVIIDNAGCRRR